MGRQEWGRRSSDNQPYPKTRDKDSLPKGLTPVAGTIRYRVPYTLTRDLGHGPESAVSNIEVRAKSRKQAISLAAKLLEIEHPKGKIRIKPDSVRKLKGVKRRKVRTRRPVHR